MDLSPFPISGCRPCGQLLRCSCHTALATPGRITLPEFRISLSRLSYERLRPISNARLKDRNSLPTIFRSNTVSQETLGALEVYGIGSHSRVSTRKSQAPAFLLSHVKPTKCSLSKAQPLGIFKHNQKREIKILSRKQEPRKVLYPTRRTLGCCEL